MKLKLRTFMTLGLATLMVLLVSSCLKVDDDPKTYSAAEEKALRETYLDSLVAQGHDVDTLENSIYYVKIEEGEGNLAKEGDTLTVGYAGYFIDGSLFDASDIHNADGKMTFILGEDRMIEGWEQGIKLMNEGAKFQFVIPSEYAYGSTGTYGIPPYQTLVFVIKLYEIQPS